MHTTRTRTKARTATALLAGAVLAGTATVPVPAWAAPAPADPSPFSWSADHVHGHGDGGWRLEPPVLTPTMTYTVTGEVHATVAGECYFVRLDGGSAGRWDSPTHCGAGLPTKIQQSFTYVPFPGAAIAGKAAVCRVAAGNDDCGGWATLW